MPYPASYPKPDSHAEGRIRQLLEKWVGRLKRLPGLRRQFEEAVAVLGKAYEAKLRTVNDRTATMETRLAQAEQEMALLKDRRYVGS